MDKKKLDAELVYIAGTLRNTPLDLSVSIVDGPGYPRPEPCLRLTLTIITDGAASRMTFPVYDLERSGEDEAQFVRRTLARLKELVGYTGRETVRPIKPPLPLPMKNYNNLISLAQDNIMTTVEVRLVNEGLSGAGYIYKLPLSIPAEEGNLVVVPTGGSAESCFKVGIIVKKHDLPLIDPNFSGEYRWVVSLVSEDARVAYSTQLQKEEEMILRLKDGEKRAATIKAKQEILSNLSLEDKQILGLEAKPLDNPS